MVRVLVVINEDGIPVISRTLGTTPPSFPAMGLLSALHSASARKGRPVTSLRTDGAHIAFKKFSSRACLEHDPEDPDGADREATADDGDLLVALVSSLDAVPRGSRADADASVLANAVHDTLVLFASGPQVAASLAVERLRKLTRCAGEVLDTVLDEAGPCSLDPRCVECAWPGIAARAAAARCLQRASEAAGTPFAALVARGAGLVAWTPDWFLSLSARDRTVIAALLASLPPATWRDVPVFLPRHSPGSAARLMTAAVTSSLELVFICGDEEVPAADAVRAAVRAGFAEDLGARDGSLARGHDDPTASPLALWAASFAGKSGGVNGIGRTLPSTVRTDGGVLAILAVHPSTGRQLVCVSPAGAGAASAAAVHAAAAAGAAMLDVRPGDTAGLVSEVASAGPTPATPAMRSTKQQQQQQQRREEDRKRGSAASASAGGDPTAAPLSPSALTPERRRYLLGWYRRRAGPLLQRAGPGEPAPSVSAPRSYAHYLETSACKFAAAADPRSGHEIYTILDANVPQYALVGLAEECLHILAHENVLSVFEDDDDLLEV